MIYQQIVGIPMGTNCAPLIADLLSSRNSVGEDIVTRPFVGGWVSEWVGAWASWWVRHALPCGHDSDWFLINHFQTSHVSCGWWEEGPYWVWVTGSKVKVNFGTLCIRPCGHDTDYRFSPITFRLHMQVVDDERKNHIDSHGVEGQCQHWHSLYKTLWTWYRLQL